MKLVILAITSLFYLSGCSTATKVGPTEVESTLRVPPKYPLDAARNNVEGFVQMNFSINKRGEPIDIEVIKSEPEGVFSREAVKALSQWKYAPIMVDGEAAIVEGLTVQLDFKLAS